MANNKDIKKNKPKKEKKKKAYLRDTGLRPHYTRRKAKGDAARNEQAKS